MPYLTSHKFQDLQLIQSMILRFLRNESLSPMLIILYIRKFQEKSKIDLMITEKEIHNIVRILNLNKFIELRNNNWFILDAGVDKIKEERWHPRFEKVFEEMGLK